MAGPIVLPSPCLVVLVGPAGSGKSMWAATRFEPGQVLSSDALRALVGEGEHDMAASIDAFALVEQIVRLRLGRRLTAVVDSLHLDAESRERWRVIAAEFGVACVALVMATPSAVIKQQNRARPLRVPDGVHAAQLKRWPAVRTEVAAEPFDAVFSVEPDTAAAPAPAVVLAAPSMVAATSRPTSAALPNAAHGSPPSGLRFGLQIPKYTWTGGPDAIAERLRAIALAAEVAGFDQLWVMDHFRQIPMMGRAWDDMLESYTTLGYLAGVTSQIRLGTMVTGVTYRNLGHLAKIIATLDVLSGGRAMCGLGTGWFKQEHEAYGWPFPTVKERYDLLRDALELLPLMWGPGTPRYAGRTITVPEAMCYPRPLQARIPILVGGSGETTTLRIVAKYADACNLFGEPDVIAHKVGVLSDHCRSFGRDPSEIEVTHLSTVFVADDHLAVTRWIDANKPRQTSAERFARSINAGTPNQHVERLRALAAAGVQRVIVSLADLDGVEPIERFAAVIHQAQSAS
jgi:F420-dependent oxidoreductase-like protein